MIPLPRLFEEDRLELIEMSEANDTLVLKIRSTAPKADCPVCRHSSDRVLCRYQRSPVDLPLVGRRLVLRLSVRKFYCDNDACPRRIFCERLPDIVAPYARTTLRLNRTQLRIALTVGGECGARITRFLGMPTSGDTLLRRIRSAPLPQQPSLKVIGVDDWAYRRGRKYGTILCDWERRCPVDLLPDRSCESLSAWLKQHPEVSVISRDRAGDYSRGATAGAPQATQVADRWHLLKNLREAFDRLANRLYVPIREAAATATQASRCLNTGASPEIVVSPTNLGPAETSNIRGCPKNQEKRREAYRQVLELHRKGVSQREISRLTGFERKTVRRYLNAGTYPEPARRRKPRSVDPYLKYIKSRWEEGCRNASQLFRELKDRGFDGSGYAVRRCVAKWRNGCSTSERQNPVEIPSASNVAWLLFKKDTELEKEDRRFIDELQSRCPTIKRARELGWDFVDMIRERLSENWSDWFDRATALDMAPEIRRFALSLKTDEAAVKAALSMEWSNGQVEGQINRLKNIKRLMYGRASFDLLRKRVLLTT